MEELKAVCRFCKRELFHNNPGTLKSNLKIHEKFCKRNPKNKKEGANKK